MQFLLVTIVLESSLTELESSAIRFLLVIITIRELFNAILTSNNCIRELSN